MVAESKVFSHSEISSHSTSQDCWVIINAKVYNVTNYLNDHPGGDDVLLLSAGKDASEEFEDAGHGSAARLMLDEFYIGEVENCSVMKGTMESVTATLQIREGKNKSTNKHIYFLLALVVTTLGVGIYFFNLST